MLNECELTRFVEAQASIIDQVRRELTSGLKRSHWMWFIFPQLRGLGHSPTAQYYAVADLAEARAYLKHPALGNRLVDCTDLVNKIEGRSVHQIFGTPDDLKFHSFVTLFSLASPETTVFQTASSKYFGGALDSRTVDKLG
jgi:uncharacterized protein (DUF1810 family)